MFIIAAALAIGVAWLTVSYHSMKAALADPVKSLRYE
jgi:putative ABC transport system permease protein